MMNAVWDIACRVMLLKKTYVSEAHTASIIRVLYPRRLSSSVFSVDLTSYTITRRVVSEVKRGQAENTCNRHLRFSRQ
jgi:hypothetical protein